MKSFTFLFSKGGIFMKKVFSGAKETHHDFLHGGHGESYQLKKCKKKVVGQIFAFITWAKWELCIHKSILGIPLSF